MKVILQQDVKSLGKKGALAEVSEGYYKNYLFPRKLAVKATADNLHTLKQKEKAADAQAEREKKQAMAYVSKLQSCVVKIAAKAGSSGKLFGSVTSKEISEALKAQYNIEVEKNKIIQNEPIKSFGSYEVKCKLGHEVSGTINVLVVEEK
ncbi:MAG: 50S ribosomal protein L9 [Clostridiales bacterium]|jgi:large subunit ribosomal protein L9|nr:50S ribosomal protein L9 [Clostridiales bacterium]